ncbi:polymeric immunoglobulin receptor-like [Hemicordylus capensis]|uniref:polymeric immunoglobulin receptor-like n=1 Tax=Hemicordylus capensis TaxID=884348 RepID=UPI0023021CDC|nr:polymeric immunoglobulin receptor-like [Hemicordylus capensis]
MWASKQGFSRIFGVPACLFFRNKNMVMKMATCILLLILLHVSGNIYGPRMQISHVGESVTIKCYYSTTTVNKHDRKYWCKESHNLRNCQTIISTNHFTLQDYEGRVSMKDIPQKGILQVTMTQLKKEDSRNYRCGIGKTNYGLHAGVNLTVLEGPNLLKSPEILWGKLGGSMTVHCPSESAEPSRRKSLCKLRRFDCSPLPYSNRITAEQHESYLSENSSGNFSVIINGLRKEDSGMYKCGTGTLDSSSRIIQLQVVEESVFSNLFSDTQATYQPGDVVANSEGQGLSITVPMAMPTLTAREAEKNRRFIPAHPHSTTPLYEPQTTHQSNHRHVTSEVYKESSLKMEPNLLSVVMPVLVVLLVLAATVITVIIKIRQRRKYATSDIVASNLDGGIPLNVHKCSEERPKEENRGSGYEHTSTASPDKENEVTTVYCLLSHVPNPEDTKEND